MRFLIVLTIAMAACVAAAAYAYARPRTAWGRMVLRTVGARPRRRFDPVRRGDLTRNAAATLLAGIALIGAGAAAFAIADGSPNQSTVNMVGSIYGFAFVILGMMAGGGAMIVAFRALTWRAPSPLAFTVYARGQAIGESNLSHRFLDQGFVMGQFIPKPTYALAEATFAPLREVAPGTANRIANSAELTAYRDRVKSLGLTVKTAAGETAPTHGIHIVDSSNEGGADLFRLEVEVADREWWTRESTPPDSPNGAEDGEPPATPSEGDEIASRLTQLEQHDIASLLRDLSQHSIGPSIRQSDDPKTLAMAVETLTEFKERFEDPEMPGKYSLSISDVGGRQCIEARYQSSGRSAGHYFFRVDPDNFIERRWEEWER